ncbi:MAG: topoisomerase IV [Ruminococcaceae bacterium]|nr:topoisomerase IV [Oscillospiraceae bacterium]
MAKKSKNAKPEKEIIHAAAVDQLITDTLEVNYMPYAMSVIISRAIPEIDGFKPSHRKLLYTMHKMGLLNGKLTKSANVVGQTMKLNPHGDAAIYETMVRLTRGNEALLHPFVESKGSFGKQYSKMAYAASRYTEVKLDPICSEIFNGIDKDSVDMIDNYDSTMKEPSLLPTSFPNVLVSPNTGIAVGMASSICSFNLAEICDTAIMLIKDPAGDFREVLKAPDFSTGAQLLVSKSKLEEIYETGRGNIRLRSKYTYQKDDNCIEVTEIPYSTTSDAIMDKIEELVKAGKLKEVTDARDETDINGLKIAIDIKRNADPDKVMAKLFKLTPLEDDFSCNFNILICGHPKVMGIREIISEWHAWRAECVKREVYYDLEQKTSKLHLLRGLEKILLDIDKAISIIRHTENDRDVIPNLCNGFDIDIIQAEFIADIKLRSLNKEYILNKTAEIEKLEKEIEDLEDTLKSSKRIDNIIIKQLSNVKNKFGIPRKTEIVYEDTVTYEPESEKIEDYPVFAVMTKDGYFKKITMQSIRGNDEQKLKDGDEIVYSGEILNSSELLFFTSDFNLYKAKMSDFEPVKSAALGEYIPSKLMFDKDEKVVGFLPETDFKGRILFAYANGKAVIVPADSYQTKLNRKKLLAAIAGESPLVKLLKLNENEERDILLRSHSNRIMLIKSSLIPQKQKRNSAGVQVFKLRAGDFVESVMFAEDSSDTKISKYRKTSVPSPGFIYNPIDINENQIKM